MKDTKELIRGVYRTFFLYEIFMQLRTICLIHRIVSLEVGIILAIRLPLLAYAILGEYSGQFADCEEYFRFWNINYEFLHPDLEFCTKTLGCQRFRWDQRVVVRLVMLSTLLKGVTTVLYFSGLTIVVWYQMLVDVTAITEIYHFWV